MRNIFMFIVMCCLLTACGRKERLQEEVQTISSFTVMPGDSTLYGLACEGSTDSVLVVLPYRGGDPDTLNIVRAFEEHRMQGRPRVGDKLAVVLNPDSADEVLMAVNVNRLQGQWCYLVYPTLRHQRVTNRPIPDSIRQRILAPREYSVVLKNGGKAYATGGQNVDKMSPVTFPRQKPYVGWQLYNGRLVLLADSTNKQTNDTATILRLGRDSLVLRINGNEQGYYKKQKTNE